MKDTTEHLARLESEVLDHGHSEQDLEWSRQAYFRLLLSRVKSSPAQGEVRRAAEAAREAGRSLEQFQGESAVWAESTARQWLSEHPERFVRPLSDTENTWSLRSALWGIPAVAAGMSFLFALFTVIPGWGPEQMSLGWILVPGAIAVPVILLHAVYSATLGRRGNLRAVVAAVVVLVVSSVLVALLAISTREVLLPQGVPWSWIAVAAWTLVAVIAWQAARFLPGRGAGDDPGLTARVHPASAPVEDGAWTDLFRSALFQRGVRGDRDVDRAVQEALTHARQSGRLAVEEFGSPWEYARALSEDPVVRPRRLTLFYAALTVLWAGLSAGSLLDAESSPDFWDLLLRGGVALIFLFTTVASGLEWRRAARADVSSPGPRGR